MSAVTKLGVSPDETYPELEVVRDLVERARRAPFFAKKLAGRRLDSWDDFFALPVTTKAELRAAEPTDTLAVPLAEIWHYHESFGTTGRPLSSWFTRADFDREVELDSRWTTPVQPGARVLNRLPYSFAVPPFVVEQKARATGGVVIPASNLNWNVSYVRTLDLIHRLRADVLVGLPLEPVILALLASRQGYDLERDLGSVRHLMLGGGAVSPALKAWLERKWKASVGLVYGLTETGGSASMCPAWRLHLHPGAFITEVVDPRTYERVAPGEVGVLLVSSYYRRGSPLVRYDTRDWCRVHTMPCPCGEAGRTFDVLGRLDDTIVLDGKTVYFADLEQAALEAAGELDSPLWFAIVTGRRLHLRLETHNGVRELAPAARDRLADTLKVPLRVEVCRKGELLNLTAMASTPEVGKPQALCDWRKDPRRSATLYEALIKWPEMKPLELLDMLWRVVKNAWLRLTLR